MTTPNGDTGHKALLQHIDQVQHKAVILAGLIEGIEILDGDDRSPAAVSSLIMVARQMADAVSMSLDSTNLPEVSA